MKPGQCTLHICSNATRVFSAQIVSFCQGPSKTLQLTDDPNQFTTEINLIRP